MNRTPEKAVFGLLSNMGIRVSASLINRLLKAHPDYPSLASITDTLDYLGIDNVAAEIEKERLSEMPVPFLAHLKTNGGEFVLADDTHTLEKKYPVFFKAWSGVVVVAEKRPGWHHTANDASLQAERKATIQKAIAVTVMLVLAATAAILSANWMFSSLLALSLAGIFISWLIVQKDMGIDTGLADRICGQEKNCDSVIKAKGSDLPGGIHWSDVGINWFAGLCATLVLSSFGNNSTGIIALFSLLVPASVPFLVFSVYYQWKIAKAWCRLCLVIVGLLCIQLAVLAPVAYRGAWSLVNSRHLFFTAMVFASLGIAWFFIKELLTQKTTLEDESFEGKRFRRTGVVFAALLAGQRNANTSPWKDDLQLGNSQAPVQVMVACNPYCNPCAKTHEVLHELLQQQAGKVGVTIRFTLKADDEKDPRTRVVTHMLRHLQITTRHMNNTDRARYCAGMIHHWFREMDFDRFTARYIDTENIDVHPLLEKHERWASESGIEYTPTIFINGYELPQAYQVTDLDGMLSMLSEVLGSVKQTGEPALMPG